jgi:hypothetical protein
MRFCFHICCGFVSILRLLLEVGEGWMSIATINVCNYGALLLWQPLFTSSLLRQIE